MNKILTLLAFFLGLQFSCVHAQMKNRFLF